MKDEKKRKDLIWKIQFIGKIVLTILAIVIGIIIIVVFAVMYFPIWTILFLVTFPFKNASKKINGFFLELPKLIMLGFNSDECDRCNNDGSSYCTAECNAAHDEAREELKKAREKWDKTIFGWIERNYVLNSSEENK